MACEDRLVHGLHERGLRLTPQREMVLHALHALGGHPSVEEVYDHVCTLSSAVDKATVYRTMQLLQNLGLVYPCDLGDGVSRYELALHSAHAHLRCERCGQVTTLEGDDWDAFCRLFHRYAFTPDPNHLVISGLCAACAQGGGERATPSGSVSAAVTHD